MNKLCIMVLVSLLVLSCKKEEKIIEEVVIPMQLLGDTDAELLGSQFWNSYQAALTGQILAGAITTHGFTIGRVENVSLSPIHSFMISRTITDSEYFAYYSQRYPRQMPVGKNLTLKANIKGVNLEGEGVSLMIECEDANLSHVQVSNTQGNVSIKGTFNWTAFTVELANLQSNVTAIYVYLTYLPNTTGTAYFDDITLTRSQ